MISQPKNTFQTLSPASSRNNQNLFPMYGNPFIPSNSMPYAPSASYIPSHMGAAPKQSVAPTKKSMHSFQAPPYTYPQPLPGILQESFVPKIPQTPALVSSTQYSKMSGNPLVSPSFKTYPSITQSLPFIPSSQGTPNPIVATFVRTYVPSFVNYSPAPINALPSGVFNSSPLSLNELISSVANSYFQTASNGLPPSYVPAAPYVYMPSYTAPQSAPFASAARVVSSTIRTYPPTPVQSGIPFVSTAPIMTPQIYHTSNPSFSTYANIPSVPNSWPSPF